MTTSPTSPKRAQFPENQHQPRVNYGEGSVGAPPPPPPDYYSTGPDRQYSQPAHQSLPPPPAHRQSTASQYPPQQEHPYQYQQQQQPLPPHHQHPQHQAQAHQSDAAQPPVTPTTTGAGPTYVFGSNAPPPQQPQYPHQHPHYPDPLQNIQPRQRAQSIPPYQTPYHPTAFGPGGVPVMIGYPGPGMQSMAYVHGVHGAVMTGPPIGRIPRAGSRRAKAHVAKACQNCKKAHLSCDEQRPCTRCVATRKESTCIDVEHKKRGRPRIQPERSQSRQVPPTTVQPASAGFPPESDHLRELRAQATRRGSLPVTSSSSIGLDPRLGHAPHGSSPDIAYSRRPSSTQSSMWRPDPSPMMIFVNMDMRIIRVNDTIRDLFATSELEGRMLEDFVDARHRDSIRELQTEVRGERSSREPNYLPGIFARDEERKAVMSLSETEVDRLAHVHGAMDRRESWTFILPNTRWETFNCRIRLIKTSTYCVAIEIQRIQSASSHSSYSSGRQAGELPPPSPYGSHPNFRDQSYGSHAPPGPASPYARSAPSSPFSNMGQHMITSLPPTNALVQSAHPSVSPNRESTYGSGSYFPRQNNSGAASSSRLPPSSSMQPPPNPSSLHRPSTGHRPEPLTNVQLPPIVSSSAPTTPVAPAFSDPPSGGPGHGQHLPSTPGMARVTTPRPQTSGGLHRDSPSDRAEDADEASRKRRRLNIGEIIDQ